MTNKTWTHPKYVDYPDTYKAKMGQVVKKTYVPYQKSPKAKSGPAKAEPAKSQAEAAAADTGSKKGSKKKERGRKAAVKDELGGETVYAELHSRHLELVRRIDGSIGRRKQALANANVTLSTPSPAARQEDSTATGGHSPAALPGDDPVARKDAPTRQVRNQFEKLKRELLKKSSTTGSTDVLDDELHRVQKSVDGAGQVIKSEKRKGPRIPKMSALLPTSSHSPAFERIHATTLAKILSRYVYSLRFLALIN